jgi:mannose-6-phosphate isomerase-like protein (cupin superfamily)
MFNENQKPEGFSMSSTHLTTASSDSARVRFDAAQGPRLIGPDDGEFAELLSLGVRFLAWGEETGGGFSLVEHPIPPRTLCAPMHRHSREDEYSFVLEGRMGARLGDEVVHAGPGDLVFKPRNQWHTFWNAGDVPCRILEIISPAGFERFFEAVGRAMKTGGTKEEVVRGQNELARRFGIEFDPESVPRLCAEHGLSFPD